MIVNMIQHNNEHDLFFLNILFLRKTGGTDWEDTRNFDKDLEELKNKQTEMNNTLSEMKNTLEGINSRITEAEEQISDLGR